MPPQNLPHNISVSRTLSLAQQTLIHLPAHQQQTSHNATVVRNILPLFATPFVPAEKASVLYLLTTHIHTFYSTDLLHTHTRLFSNQAFNHVDMWI